MTNVLHAALGVMRVRANQARIRRFASACTRAGGGLVVDGAPVVENEGSLVIGARARIDSRFAPARFVVMAGASISIGDDAELGFGATLAASQEITIGDRVHAGAYLSIVDANEGLPDVHVEGELRGAVRIGDDVDIGSRVTILRGTTIGKGSLITGGSVVSGVVPELSVVSGNPARIVGSLRHHLAHEALYATVAQKPDAPAIVTSAETLSYAALWGRVRAIARALDEAGVGPGDRVLYVSSRKAGFLAAMYACLARGAVAVPIPEAAARATVTDLKTASGATVLLADETSLARFEPRLGASDGLRVVDHEIASRNVGPSTARDFLMRGLAPSSPAMILFTSGTTAKKKAVLLTHRALLQATTNINAFMRPHQGIREYVAIPLAHSFGLGRARAVFAVGGTLVLDDGLFNPAGMAKAIETHECDALSAVPATLAMFAGRLEAPLLRVGPRIRLLELGSAFLPVEGKRRLLDIFPNARVCMHYGLTEASRSTFLEFRSESSKLDTVGRASPNVDLRVCRSDGTRCAPHEKGEILVAGGHVTAGYFGDPELTAGALDKDGAFRTGDFGFLDEGGYLHLLGRKDEMINAGGVKISPLELEEKIREAFPALDFCVLGMPDEAGLAGELPVVAYTGETTITLPNLVSALSQRIEKNKLPNAVVRVERIPRTENGKPIRRELRTILIARGKLA